jgi:hypothetical protein
MKKPTDNKAKNILHKQLNFLNSSYLTESLNQIAQAET